MGQRLRISVALCTYNGERFIDNQLKSILTQTLPPDEIIVCDDGSSDRTLQIIELLSARTSIPVRIVRTGPQCGITDNFNAAVCACRGDIIFLSDQDDVWDSRRIDLMSAFFIQDKGVGLVYCDANVVDGDLRATGKTVFSQRPHLYKPEVWSPYLLMRGAWIKGCMMAFRSYLAPALTPFPREWYYDHWIAFIAASTGRVASVNVPLMDHRRHGNNSSDDPFTYTSIKRTMWNMRNGGSHDYNVDVIRWQIAMEKLMSMLNGQLSPPSELHKAQNMLTLIQRRLAFARIRNDLHQLPRFYRIRKVAQHIIRGNYHCFVAGWGSIVRDLFY